MTDPTPAALPLRDRRIRVALAVSVALNLAVLGLGVGLVLHGPPGHGDMVRELGFGPFNDALSDRDRKALREAFMARMPDFRAERARMQSDAAAILAALRAEPFDPARLTAAMGAMQSHITDRLSLGGSLMQDFLVSLSPEDRRAFADRLEASLRHGPGGGD